MNPAILFAQQKNPFGPGGPGDIPPEAIAIIVGIVVVAALIGLAINIFYCLTLSKALSKVSPGNRQMEPGMVWLLLIPCFSIIWNFFIVTRIPASLQAEFQDRDMDDGTDYGRQIGMTAAITLCVEVVMSCIPFVNYCAGLVGIVYFVLWIIFWVKMAGYSSQLSSSSDRSRSHDDY